MEADSSNSAEELFEVAVSTRQLLLKWNAELRAMGLTREEDEREQEVGNVGSRVLKCVLKMVENRLLEDTHKYTELQEKALETRDRILEHQKCIEKVKGKLRMICSMSEEAKSWMDDEESEESSPSPSHHHVH